MIAKIPLEKRAPNTLTDPETLEAELQRIRGSKVGLDNEEFIEGMVAVSVPITDAQGRMCAGLATHAPIQRMTLEQAMAHVPALRHAAAELSALLSETPEAGET